MPRDESRSRRATKRQFQRDRSVERRGLGDNDLKKHSPKKEGSMERGRGRGRDDRKHRDSTSPSNNNRSRNRRGRKRSVEYADDNDRRKKSHRRQRSPSHGRRSPPTIRQAHRNSRRDNDDDNDRYRRRRRSLGSQSPPRRSSRRRRRRRPRRRADAGGSASSHSSRRPPVAADVPPRAGVVSDDDEGLNAAQAATGEARKDVPPAAAAKTKRSSASSSRDDTIGHFKGRAGTVIADRYRIIREVGVGTFGRVVECLDLKKTGRASRKDRQENVVAIKIVRNVKRYYESALIEADIVEDVNRRGGRGVSHCAKMFDAFTFAGHYCMVFESLGPSLYDFLKRQKYQPFPLECVRDFAKQLLETLEFLHSFKLIHTDLKPENVLLLNGREVSYKGYNIPECTRIKVIDFGGATYDNKKKSSVVNTRQYRAPEVILGTGWSMPSDLWSVGKITIGETHSSCRGVPVFISIFPLFTCRLYFDRTVPRRASFCNP